LVLLQILKNIVFPPQIFLILSPHPRFLLLLPRFRPLLFTNIPPHPSFKHLLQHLHRKLHITAVHRSSAFTAAFHLSKNTFHILHFLFVHPCSPPPSQTFSMLLSSTLSLLLYLHLSTRSIQVFVHPLGLHFSSVSSEHMLMERGKLRSINKRYAHKANFSNSLIFLFTHFPCLTTWPFLLQLPRNGR
ncbi:hypothetical protein Csa_024003, partial [Cucumis sativus]